MRVLGEELAQTLLPLEEKQVALVLDADRTLAPVDTGRLIGKGFEVNGRIRSVFEERGYSTKAFLEVASVWGSVPEVMYLAAIERALPEVALHAGWRELLPQLSGEVQVVVVTAGIPQLWKNVLSRAGLSETPVIGGCRVGTDNYVVCPQGKASVVRTLQKRGMRVTAAGDSAIDLPMLQAADVGLVVPDYKGSPRLFEALQTQTHSLRHLALDERTFGLARVGVTELLSELLEETC
jgi:phosphoserine phosphatase